MKRTVFITIGFFLLLILFSVWVYLLMFGSPKQVDDIFANIGLGDRATPIEQTGPEDLLKTAELNINSGTLVQLTTRPVAGFDFISNGSSTTSIIYAEKGTGHVYKIDMINGTETRVSAKTSAAVIDAAFAPDGSAVALTAEEGNDTTSTLEELNGQTNHNFPTKATNIKFVSHDRVRYQIKDEGGSVGYEYNLETGTTDTIFQIPLTDVSMIWEKDETLLYNQPAPRLKGALYLIKDGVLNRIGNSYYALSALSDTQSTDVHIITGFDPDTGVMRSHLIDKGAGDSKLLPITVLPEKCAFGSTQVLWCAAPTENMSRNGQNNWYKGVISFDDLIWRLDLTDDIAKVVDELSAVTGRSIDVIDMKSDDFGTNLLFKNKRDDTLWLRKLPN